MAILEAEKDQAGAGEKAKKDGQDSDGEKDPKKAKTEYANSSLYFILLSLSLFALALYTYIMIDLRVKRTPKLRSVSVNLRNPMKNTKRKLRRSRYFSILTRLSLSPDSFPLSPSILPNS